LRVKRSEDCENLIVCGEIYAILAVKEVGMSNSVGASFVDYEAKDYSRGCMKEKKGGLGVKRSGHYEYLLSCGRTKVRKGYEAE
jgi:hypothetical protein